MTTAGRGKRPGKVRTNKKGIERRRDDEAWRPTPPQPDSNPKGWAFTQSEWEKRWFAGNPRAMKPPLKPKTSKPVPMPIQPNSITPRSSTLRRNFVRRNPNI